MVRVIETVEYTLVARMREILERDLKTRIPLDDPARVYTVVLGKYTGEIEGRIVLSVHPDHPLGYTMDRLNASAEYRGSRAERYRGGRYPAESIGGVRWRHIFGTVQVRSVLSVDPAEAVPIIALVKTRVAKVINEEPTLIDISDDFTYNVFGLETTDDYGYASGGEGTGINIVWIDWIAHTSFRRRRS